MEIAFMLYKEAVIEGWSSLKPQYIEVTANPQRKQGVYI